MSDSDNNNSDNETVNPTFRDIFGSDDSDDENDTLNDSKTLIPVFLYLKFKSLNLTSNVLLRFSLLEPSLTLVSSFKNSLILFCEASACLTVAVTHPTKVTGHVNILTYIMNSATTPISIFPFIVPKPTLKPR